MTEYRDVRNQEELEAALAIDGVIPVCVGSNYFSIPSGSATVEASGSATVRAYGSATVRASGSATVEAYGSATVEAYGSATVRAYGSATVRAYDSATVRASGSATVRASRFVAVHKMPGHRVDIVGGVVIEVPDFESEADIGVWAGYVGAGVEGDAVTVFKAVGADLKSRHGALYEVGSTVVADDWEANRQCGRGLHFSQSPYHARGYRFGADREGGGRGSLSAGSRPARLCRWATTRSRPVVASSCGRSTSTGSRSNRRRGEMPLAVDDAERKRRKKHADYLLRSGRPQYVRDIGPLVAHIKWLNGEGMSCLQIARAAGVADTTVQQALKGARRGVEIGGVYRAQYEAILGVRPGPPPASGGARLCPVGTRRRLQALAAAGFPAPFLARELGWSRKEYVVKWTSDDVSRSFVTWAVRQAVFSTYRRLQLVDPVSVGLSRQQVTRSVNAARRNGWAPPGCWDPETIDDPLAWPEWTGRCGSVEGFRVHLRERIPVCARCWDGALVKRGSTSHRRR